ncbi:S100P-binding protein-like isoform X1 [Acipenser oxyrinchus oxyrinchus]|uniref:S100P-binding protein n=1 Tax=Acipenser oxyrinchus oxyrinchus TaxID=40147 RepID=A0AAD8CF78_ACIOX|nr:S100P-binding protein-like isoform X1 [Acipenser oxyrinchus oxyrinchus]
MGFCGLFQCREVMFKDTELERRKEMYLQCVSGHITDHDEQNQGVMNELLSLMNTVARQEGRISDRQWQHPSDLTSRQVISDSSGTLNYSSGTDKLANKISLQDWQSKNRKYFRRFASIPDKFQRSQVPQTAAL